jgi:hypothetical protein
MSERVLPESGDSAIPNPLSEPLLPEEYYVSFRQLQDTDESLKALRA